MPVRFPRWSGRLGLVLCPAMVVTASQSFSATDAGTAENVKLKLDHASPAHRAGGWTGTLAGPSDQSLCQPRDSYHWLPKQRNMTLTLHPEPAWLNRCINDRSFWEASLLPRWFGVTRDLLHQGAASRFLEAREMETKAQKARATGNADQMEALKERQTQLMNGAESLYLQALKLYTTSLRMLPHAEVAEALFSLGTLQYRLGKIDKALESYIKLIRDFPDSELVPQAHLAIGEIRFESGDWREADQSFSMVLNMSPTVATACASYMEGWTNLRRGFFSLARRSFLECAVPPSTLPGRGDSTAKHLSSECASAIAALDAKNAASSKQK